MDLKSMVQTIFSPENLAKMTKDTGLGTDEVKSVIGKAVPFLANADNKEKGEAEAIRAISEEAGVSEGGTKAVLTDRLPLLMGLMGGGTDSGSTLDSAFGGSAAAGGNTLDSAFAGNAAVGGNTLDSAFGGNTAVGGNPLGSLFGGSAQGVDLSGGSAVDASSFGGDSAGGMDMFSMLSSLFGGMDSGGADMSDLFGGMLGGGQELTVEQGSVPNAAPTVDQAFQQPVQQAAEQVQEEVQEESAGGLLGLLDSLFGRNK